MTAVDWWAGAEAFTPRSPERGRWWQKPPTRSNLRAPMITRDDVLHVARLARLELAEPEIERMIQDLGKILGYMAELNQLDTRAVPPTAHIAVDEAPFRADEVVAGLPSETALREAPRQSDGGFAVPAFVDEG
jgi:aspartyl-tRNA(Asn)/glutamyl-tRNA(Gln) amidotransferase subunit C